MDALDKAYTALSHAVNTHTTQDGIDIDGALIDALHALAHALEDSDDIDGIREVKREMSNLEAFIAQAYRDEDMEMARQAIGALEAIRGISEVKHPIYSQLPAYESN